MTAACSTGITNSIAGSSCSHISPPPITRLRASDCRVAAAMGSAPGKRGGAPLPASCPASFCNGQADEPCRSGLSGSLSFAMLNAIDKRRQLAELWIRAPSASPCNAAMRWTGWPGHLRVGEWIMVKRARFQAILLSLISAAALVAAIVSPAYARPAAGQSNVLVLPLTSNNLWVLTADPGQGTDGTIAGLIYAGLVKLDSHNRVVPDLAAALPQVSNDRLTYTFTLRPNLHFAYGTSLTSK